MIRLIGLDLDGTVLNSKKQITEYMRSVLITAIKKGIHIVPVTGRPYHGIPKQILEIPGIRYIITTNGAITLDYQNGKLLRQKSITKEVCEQILNNTAGLPIIREIFANGYGYETRGDFEIFLKHVQGKPIQSYVEQSRVPVDDIHRFLKELPVGIDEISLMGIPGSLREDILEFLSEIKNVRVVHQTPGELEINAYEADKGFAILELGHMLGIRREEMMAIGDSNNDIGLLKSVGLPVAMGNASKEIKEIADFITLDHDHDGAAEAIKSIL
ncbi:MAG: Cof-type HAD-IIB family hydrolase [Roseburia sp.]